MAEAKPKPEKDNASRLLSRADFLKIAGVTALAGVLSELVITGPLSSEAIQGIGADAHPHQGSSEHEWHMAIDLAECIGCGYCMKACQAVNDVADDEMRWNIVFPERTEDGADFYMNRPCQHCQEAPCVRVCPVGATWVRPDGIVAMDYNRCIGCRYCEVACPYDVRRFNWKEPQTENPYQPTWGEAEVTRRPRGVVEKCTFCVHRIDRGLALGLNPGVDRGVTPACVEVCPVNARVFGDIRDPDSPVNKFLATHDTFRLRQDWGTEPKVHYVRPQKKEA
jgi:Fe-S-cluster-containing dehydrogenase component